MERFEPYDVDRALREAREAMHRTDPVSLAVVALAEGYARKMRAQFADRDLRLVVEVLIVSAASLGVLVDSNLSVTAVNVQAVAPVTGVPMLEAALLVRAAQSSAGAPDPGTLSAGSDRCGAATPEAPAAALVFRPRGVVHVTTDPLTPSGRRLTTGGRTACRARTRRLSVMPRGEASQIMRSRRVCARCTAKLSAWWPQTRDAELAAFSFLTVANLATVTRSCTTVAQTHVVGRLALMLFGPEPLTPKARRTSDQQALVDLHQGIHAQRAHLVPLERTEEERQALRQARADEAHDAAERRKATRRAAAVENANERRRGGRYLTPAERDLLTSSA